MCCYQFADVDNPSRRGERAQPGALLSLDYRVTDALWEYYFVKVAEVRTVRTTRLLKITSSLAQ